MGVSENSSSCYSLLVIAIFSDHKDTFSNIILPVEKLRGLAVPHEWLFEYEVF